MRNIKKTHATSTVTYIDRDGNQQSIIIDGNIRTAETFFRYAEPINDNDNDNDNE